MAAKKAKRTRARGTTPAVLARPWERRPEESPEVYKGFVAYRDCGPERTLREAAERVGKSLSMLARWSRRYGWRERTFAWDLEQDREAEAALRAARHQALQRQAQDANRLQRLAMARLGKSVRRNPDTDELELDPEVSIQDAVRIYKLGLAIEHMLPGESETGPREEVDDSELRRMTDEELRRLIALAKQRADEAEKERTDEQ